MASLVEALGDDFEFSIVMQVRDQGCDALSPSIQANTWQRAGKASICYLSPERFAWLSLRRLIANTLHDILTCCES